MSQRHNHPPHIIVVHEGKRIQIAHLVRHVARHDADALIAIDNPSIDQMPGTVLQRVSIEQTIHDLGGTNDPRTRSQYLQQRRDERLLALGLAMVLTISLPLIVCSGMASSRPRVRRISCKLELKVLGRTQRGAPSLRLKQPSIFTTS